MLITRFNSIIRNKTVWTIFAILVCVSFVGTGLSVKLSGGCSENTHDEQTAEGRIFGKYISPIDFMTARYHELGMRANVELNEEQQKLLRKRAWQRIAVLETAKKYGIKTSDSEIASVIQRDRTFHDENGAFNPYKYKKIIEEQLHIDVHSFENFLREEIIIQKMRNLLENSVWMSPDEMDKRIASLTDSFTVKLAAITNKSDIGKIKPSRKDAEEYYHSNSNLFAIPETRSVYYVSFPIEKPDINTNDSTVASEILSFYDENSEKFAVTDTNGYSITPPLEEVKDKIIEEIKLSKGTKNAKNKASDFVLALANNVNNQDFFKTTASNMGLTVEISPYFTKSDPIPNMKDTDLSFNETAFQLDPNDPERSYSDSVLSSNRVFVMAIRDVQPPRIPQFDEVVDKIMPFVTSNLVEKAMMEKVAKMREDLLDVMQKKNKTFDESAKKLGLNIYTSLTGSVFSGFGGDFKYEEELRTEIVSLRKGELSQPIKTEDGFLLAYVDNREPAEFASIQMIIPQITAVIDRYRASLLYPAWTEYLLQAGKFEDLFEKRQHTDYSEED